MRNKCESPPFRHTSFFFFFDVCTSPAARISGFEKVLLMVQKKKIRASRENPCKAYRQGDACSPSPVRVPPNQRHLLFPLTRLYIVLYGGRPQAVVVSAFLSVSSGHGTQRFLAKPRYATPLKKVPIKWNCVGGSCLRRRRTVRNFFFSTTHF